MVQLPAGMRDPHETDLVKSALRELKEETGFVGREPINESILRLRPVLESPVLYNDPWKSNETTNLVTLELDLAARGEPELEDDEDIEVIVLDLEDLAGELREIREKRGFEVDNRV